jgi:putative acetyltransferase
MAMAIRNAVFEKDLEIVRRLLREYAAYLNASLGEEHICLSHYERELARLPGAYAEPEGVILLAFASTGEGEEAAGCVALKPLKPERAMAEGEAACEMKRLWVRSEFRGQSIGLALADRLVEHARGQGYTAIYLDTVPAAMRPANGMYRKLGFQRVPRYDTNPILGVDPRVAVEFFRLELRARAE